MVADPRAHSDAPEVREQDRLEWAAARDLADVGQLTARWLEGEIWSQPAYAPNFGPDPETEPLIATLTAANRAGYLTVSSQPGCAPEAGFDGAIWAQRAAVEGFVHRGRLLDELVTRGREAGLFVVLKDACADPFSGAVAGTTRDRMPYTVYGRRPRDYRDSDLMPVAAAADIERAEYLTLVDREFVERDLLWEVVAAAVLAVDVEAR